MRRSALVLPLAALGLGLLVVGLSETGTAERPVLAVPVFLLAAAAGLAPLRAGLPTAIVLAFLEGTIVDFLGSPARYWKEAFVVALVVQALLARRPSRAEVAAAAAVAAVFLGYYAGGTSANAVGWAAKILLLSAIAAWAVYRLRPDSRVWGASFSALAVGAGANFVVAVWQRMVGFQHLAELGLPYGERIRQVPDGDLRAFGAFTGAASFSYALALAFLAWLALLLGSAADRRRALDTAWVPTAALAGIALSLDRIALVATSIAMLVVLARGVRRRARLALLAVAPVAVGLVFAVGASSGGFLAEGFLLTSESAKVRKALWGEYARELSAFGAGPGASGAAYVRSAEPGELPVNYVGWFAGEQGPPPFRWMGTTASLVVGLPGAVRPRSGLILLAASRARPRALTFVLGQRVLATKIVRPEGMLSFTLRLPPGRGRALLTLRARPAAEAAGAQDRRRVAIRVAEVRARLVATQTEQIYQRAVERQKLGVAALAGTEPGVVDNLYLSWLYQYGVLVGGVVCVLYAAVLLWPLVRSSDSSLVLTARFWGVFMVVAAIVVNVWEEFPTDLLVGLVFGQALALLRRPA